MKGAFVTVSVTKAPFVAWPPTAKCRTPCLAEGNEFCIQ
jgi:hypothetical protein